MTSESETQPGGTGATARTSRPPLGQDGVRGPSHVCIFTSAHPVDDVRVYSKIASSLLDLGCRVTWIGPAAAYFAASTAPDPRITYIPIRPVQGRVDRLLSALRAARAASGARQVDWWYSPDPDAAAVALRVARKHGGRVIFDVHEVFHAALLDRWLRGHQLSILRKVVRRLIRRTCAGADLVIGVSRSVLAPYLPAPDRGVVVRNCAPRWFTGHASTERKMPVPLRVMHGKILQSNGTATVLKALAAPGTDGIQVVLQAAARPSAFAADIERRVSESDLRNSVQVLAGLPHEEIPALLRSTDVGMIAYGRGLGEDSLPNRLFEYMAAGLAILAPSYAVEIKRIVESELIGLTVDFENPAEIAEALRWFRDHPAKRAAMGRRAETAFAERHNWDTEFDKMIAAMAEVG